MGIDKLISSAWVLAVLAAATGQLPKVINDVRRAQFRLIQESKASQWGKPMFLKGSK